MKELWRQVDGLLRGREAFSSEEALGKVQAKHLLVMVLLLAAVYGLFMGLYAVFSREVGEYRQMASCAFKVPALYVLTLFICYPSLYVFSTLLGSRLSFWSTLRLLLAVTTITVTVLASFGPIVGFFALSTESYPFMKLLNVAFFTAAGFLGVGALVKAWKSLVKAQEQSAPPVMQSTAAPPPIPQPGMQPYAVDDSTRQINKVFRLWIVIYALVGCQMAWVLRPFVLDPGSEFAWFRARHANFFVDVWHTIWKLLS
ncbi:MAG: hypothetical protein PCFJNLEI_03783 [Verrucomicrobiae bacterium]|nr:hypothetical protein [Verrucomicrobiae bacterium]